MKVSYPSKSYPLLALGLAALLLGAGCGPLSPSYDVLIKDGKIYDGFSAQPYVADIGVRGGRIIAVGNIAGPARKTIDAQDLVVTPGFIDVTNHCDQTFKSAGLLKYLAFFLPEWKGNYNYLYQGVTTVVTGTCGQGFAPAAAWAKLARALRFGSNIYWLAPHGVLRQKLFGRRGRLDERQIAKFQKAIDKEMKKGALGLSLGLEYPPGEAADLAELVALAQVVKKYDGLVSIHLRDYTGRIDENGDHAVLAALRQAIEVARQAKVPVHIAHLELAAPRHGLWADALIGPIAQARANGLDVSADQCPYTANIAFLDRLVPDKFKTAGGRIKEEYKSPSGRDQVRAALSGILNYLGPEQIMFSRYPADKKYEGRTLAEVAGLQGRKSADLLMELVYQDEKPLCVFFDQSPETVAALMPYEFVFTASDGGGAPRGSLKPHPKYFGTFPRKLKRYVLDGGIMGFNSAVKTLTSLPAAKFRLKDRGRIDVGCRADIAVLDLAKLADNATYNDPRQYASGVRYLLVNGVLAIDQGKTTGARGGQVCRRAPAEKK